MPDLFHFSPEMQDYFRSLPPQLQQQITQSAGKFNSLPDLEAFVEARRGTEA